MLNTVAGLADALRRARLLQPAQFDELARDLQPRFPEPRALAGELIQRGWLTPYQINQLFNGRGAGLLLGSYVLLEKLGEGGMGEVYKARNWKLGQVVALKLIRKERLGSPDAVRRFHREIRAAAQLDHPNIVRAFDADEVGGAHLLVMEYIQGVDLAQLVKQQGPPPWERACDYGRQVALGLQHAGERGLVHRDIKPHNLLLTSQGVVKILDMGLARLGRAGDDEGSSTVTREGAVMGTLDFIAPEQAVDSHGVDIRAHLYSLGCTLYYLLAGRVPFPGGEALGKLLRHRLDEPEPLERLRPGVPAAATAVVRKLMAKRPEDRYQTPAEAAAALAAALRGPAVAAARSAVRATEATAVGWSSLDAAASGAADAVAPAPARRRGSWRPSPWLLLGTAAGVALLALGLTGLFWMLSRAPGPPPVVARPPVPEPPPRRDTAEEAFEKWARTVAALPAERQGDAVGAELQKRNPGFDGEVNATVENGVVTGLQFTSDNVTDVKPVRALKGLKNLSCRGDNPGKRQLADLSPLKGMPLTALDCCVTKVSDLSPLKEMPLTALRCEQTKVSDLSPLKGMPLTTLECQSTTVTDLSPLKGMPLSYLSCYQTQVSDLSPLKGMPLTYLDCRSTKVTDLSLLKDLPLHELLCDYDLKRDLDILRSIPTLVTINSRSAAEFLPDPTSDGSGLVGTWTLDHDGFTEEIRITRTEAGMWDVKGSIIKDGKEIGSYGGVAPRFADGKLTYLAKWVVNFDGSSPDYNHENWTYKDRLQTVCTPPGGAPVRITYSRVAK